MDKKGFCVSLFVAGKFKVGVRVFAETKDEAWLLVLQSPAYEMTLRAVLGRHYKKHLEKRSSERPVSWEVRSLSAAEVRAWVNGQSLARS